MYPNIMETRSIYASLGDDCSREIFSDRLLYSCTGDYQYIRRMLNRLSWVQEFCDLFKKFQHPDSKLFLYGAGIDAARFLQFYPKCPFEAFCDKSEGKQHQGFQGHRVVPPSHLFDLIKKGVSIQIVITTARYNKEIESSLLSHGISKTQILNFGEIVDSLIRSQYFESALFSLTNQEVFVDGGCFDTTTSLQFIKACNGQYKQILAFEPELENYNICKDRFKTITHGKIYHGGLWKEHGTMDFIGNAQGGHLVSGNGKGGVPVYSLDLIDDATEISFIKLDIEGAELDALHGAESIIRSNHPKLAICVYHKPEDIITIPSLILEYNPAYSLFFRHYSFVQEETVLYAIP